MCKTITGQHKITTLMLILCLLSPRMKYSAVILKCIIFITSIIYNIYIIDYRLISEESFETDTELVNKLSKNVPKKPSYLKRDLDARAHSEAYR